MSDSAKSQRDGGSISRSVVSQRFTAKHNTAFNSFEIERTLNGRKLAPVRFADAGGGKNLRQQACGELVAKIVAL